LKSFGISVVLLVIVIVAVFCNAYYADRLYFEILDSLNEFPDTADASSTLTYKMMRAKEKFEKNTGYFYYILSRSDIQELICDFSDIFSYYRTGDTASYTASLEKAKLRLTMIKNSERMNMSERYGSLEK